MMRIGSGILAAAFMLSFSAALADSAMTGDGGMALYTFDMDSGGASACYDDCAKNWPPYLAKEGENKGESWTQVDRTDGTKQWAYDGKPLYYFAKDSAGTATGDGMGGVWHVLKE